MDVTVARQFHETHGRAQRVVTDDYLVLRHDVIGDSVSHHCREDPVGDIDLIPEAPFDESKPHAHTEQYPTGRERVDTLSSR